MKTNGEGLLAVFQERVKATHAGLHYQRKANRNTESINVHVGVCLHSGQGLVVTQNGQLGYFGATQRSAMSMADQLQGNLLLTESVYSDPIVSELVREFTVLTESLTIDCPDWPRQPVLSLAVKKRPHIEHSAPDD